MHEFLQFEEKKDFENFRFICSQFSGSVAPKSGTPLVEIFFEPFTHSLSKNSTTIRISLKKLVSQFGQA